YDQLLRLDPSPIVRLNRAIAIAELDGPQAALAEVDRPPLADYHPYHATRADLLRRLGRRQAARAAFGGAITPTGNTAAAAYLIRRRDQLGERWPRRRAGDQRRRGSTGRLPRQDGQDPHDMVPELRHVAGEEVPCGWIGDLA